MKTIRIHLKPNYSASDYYRAILPYRQLKAPLAQEGVRLEIAHGHLAEEEIDALVCHRLVHTDFFVHLTAQRYRNLNLAWDTDDSFNDIPPWSPLQLSQNDRNVYACFPNLADKIWCSTEALRHRLEYDSFTTVLPNLLDIHAWRGGAQPPEDEDEIRILWAGSNTHAADLTLIEGAVANILRIHPKVVFCFMGDMPANWIASWWGRVRRYPWCPVEQYPQFLQSIRPHIGLAPLVDHPFNECKSDIKAIEYTMAGAAVVASGVAYAEVPGVAVASTETGESWVDMMDRLIVYKDMRKRGHAEAMAYACAKRVWNVETTKVWLDAYMGLVK